MIKLLTERNRTVYRPTHMLYLTNTNIIVITYNMIKRSIQLFLKTLIQQQSKWAFLNWILLMQKSFFFHFTHLQWPLFPLLYISIFQ